MRAGGRILMIFGVVLGIVAAAATFIILRETTPAPGEEGAAPTVETRTVIVAFQTIEPYQEIPIDAIGPREYPEPIPADAVLIEMPAAASPDTGDAAAVEGGPIPGVEFVAGKLSNTRIYPGQVIVTTQLVDKELEEQRLGLGSDLSYIIPEGQVAMAIPIDQISSVAGALKAGDQVDMIGTFNVIDETDPDDEGETVTQFFLQKVQILRVGAWSVTDDQQQQDQAAVGGVVTVLLEPQQALEVKRLRESVNWEFVLRAITDESDFVTEPVSDQYLIEQFNLAP